MSENHINCPQCRSSNTYQDASLWVCAECFHEWIPSDTPAADRSVELANTPSTESTFKDANGVILQTGDTVALIKDLKVGSQTLKSGTKVKNIRLLADAVDGHDISCKIEGYGSMYLKCSVVKKIN